jgi:hypothetical protein
VKKDGTFLQELEAGVRRVLLEGEISIAERLKAIEVGSRLLMIRHKIEMGGGDDSGSFFDNKK